VRAALRAPDDYGSYLGFGIAAMFGIQALVNLAVALAILPTKGLTLPFVSFGGSSLIVNAAAAGILLNVSRQGPRVLSEETAPPPPVRRTSTDEAVPSMSMQPASPDGLSP
jgi:cell division protein FtsW